MPLIFTTLVFSLPLGLVPIHSDDSEDGLIALAELRYDDAIRCFTNAINHSTNSDVVLSAHTNRAAAYGAKNELDNAIKDYDAVIQLAKPEKVESKTAAYFERGICMAKKGEPIKALSDCSEAIRLSPKNEFAWYKRGVCYTMFGDYEKALDDFYEAINIDPDYVDALMERGRARCKLRLYDSGIMDFTRVISLQPRNDGAFNYRGTAYAFAGKFESAVADFNEAIRIDPKSSQAYFKRGCVYKRLKQFSKAKEDYATAFRLDPTLPHLCQFYSWLLATCPDQSIRDGKEAVVIAKQAVSQKQGHVQYRDWDALAAAEAEAGNFDEAIRCQKLAIAARKEVGANSQLGERFLTCYQNSRPYREEK
jgi:tetratricopeptide (TPR) repeat protein